MSNIIGTEGKVSTASKLPLEPTQPPIQWVLGPFPLDKAVGT
jgi:hypothetical protein